MDVEVAAGHRQAGELLDGQEDRRRSGRRRRRLRGLLFVAVAQPERHLGRLAGAADQLVGIQGPLLGDRVDLLLDQRREVGIVDFFFLSASSLNCSKTLSSCSPLRL